MSGTVGKLFDMYSGNDVAFDFVVKDENDVPVDVTGWTISTTMKLSPKQTDAQAPVAVDSVAGDTADSAQGIVKIFIPKAQTAKLIAATYLFEMQRSFNGITSTVIYGKVKVLGGITQRTVA